MTAEFDSHPETYDVCAYWGARKESPEECAQRTAVLLGMLAECDSLLAHWYVPTRSRKDALKHPLMPPDISTLTERFRRGVNREKGGPVFEDLGFTFWFGNGGSGETLVDLRIKCGAYSGGSSNYCWMTLPRKGPHFERMVEVPVLTNFMRAMFSAWSPDWMLTGSNLYRMKYREPDASPFSLGWMTYLANHVGRVPPLPAPVRIEPVEDKGMLILLTPERFTVSNPEHVALARRVRELLARAGLMPPVTP
ncbi:immunity 52 family protein [Myxococcus fulvus]|uniref:immunity 52 family protein n=1 Tax=Myxococcus fulvus TaxID=33 RepID=UPI003B9C3C03